MEFRRQGVTRPGLGPAFVPARCRSISEAGCLADKATMVAGRRE